jgi:hypothetical protein
VAASSNTRHGQLTSAIITTHYRYKRPPRKRKPVALEAPAGVRKRGRADAAVPPTDEPEPATPSPANDDSRPPPAPAAKSAIATSISRKRTKFLRTEQAAEPAPDDPEADAAMPAWLERAKWGHGPAR